MARLKATAELAWRQMFPNPTDETPITREEFIETAKLEYAYQAWLMHIQEKDEQGYWNVNPSLLEISDPLPVKDNYVDLSELKIFKTLQHEAWLQNVGGLACECEYVKRTVNTHQLLCDDDSLDDDAKPFMIIGERLWFPEGTHAKEITIIYAKEGSELDDDLEVDEKIAALVRTRLVEIYGGRIGNPDETNNTNSAT